MIIGRGSEIRSTHVSIMAMRHDVYLAYFMMH